MLHFDLMVLIKKQGDGGISYANDFAPCSLRKLLFESSLMELGKCGQMQIASHTWVSGKFCTDTGLYYLQIYTVMFKYTANAL